jgi:uncharacterized membrane protein
MFLATVFALMAAVLHAGWNLLVKQGGDDRFLLLWGQFFLAGLMVIPIILFAPAVSDMHSIPLESWKWVALSGSVHLPYCIYLARAYKHGDFSVVYPVARGGGALLAAIGGVLFLSDHLSLLSALGIVIAGFGLVLLTGPFRGASRESLSAAAIVAVTIGIYSLSDARGIRTSGTNLYALATHVGTTTSTTMYGVITGKTSEMRRVLRTHWRRLALVAIAATVTYTLVQLALKRAPVGYVTALRESSVVLAAFIGWRKLGESVGFRRIGATVLFVIGLTTLVIFKPRPVKSHALKLPGDAESLSGSVRKSVRVVARGATGAHSRWDLQGSRNPTDPTLFEEHIRKRAFGMR